MKKWILFFCFIFIFYESKCETTIIIPQTYAAGNASVARTGDWLPFHNPALMEGIHQYTVSLLYQNRFGLKELSTESASLLLPLKNIQVGISAAHFGFSSYTEMLVGLAAAHTFDKLLTIGIQINYYSVRDAYTEQNKGVVIPQIGLLSQISPQCYIGFSTYNPTRQQIHYALETKDVPSVFNLGASYLFSKQFIGLAELSKTIHASLEWRFGFEYQPIDLLTIRLGGYGSPLVSTLGIGLKINPFRVNLNVERHPVLGLSSVAGLQYCF
ncbi:MAG: hypothetical protein ACP5F6_09005 [Microbacter sp.]